MIDRTYILYTIILQNVYNVSIYMFYDIRNTHIAICINSYNKLIITYNIIMNNKKYSLTYIIIFISIIFSLITAINCNTLTISHATNINKSPNTIIPNHKETLNEINNVLVNDNLNYTFKKEEINNNILNFKESYLKTINNHISNNQFQYALNYLNEYYYLFINDEQINKLKDFLNLKVSSCNLIEYKGDIEILSFQPLISYPDKVLNKQNPHHSQLDNNYLTINEFNNILHSLYDKNYILISPTLLSENTYLPKNKKPLILVLENSHLNSKLGTVDKLLLNNGLSTYTSKTHIGDRIQDNNDFITILNNFVDSHPDFSFNNAKALIAIDGKDGIFGYNTQRTNATSKYEIKKALEVINYLSNNGFEFVSRGYDIDVSDNIIFYTNGVEKWNSNIGSFITPKAFFTDCSIDKLLKYQDKCDLLKKYNFNLFIGIDSINNITFIQQLNANYIGAKKINGTTLRQEINQLSHLFDCEKVYDHINRNVPFNI